MHLWDEQHMSRHANAKPCILPLVWTFVFTCLVRWMIQLSMSNKDQTRHIGKFTLYSFNTPSGASVAGGRSIRSHNGLAPPPHAGHHPGHTLLWDGVPFLNQESLPVSQRGCVGHSNAYSTPKLIPQVSNRVEVWTLGRPFHSLFYHILEVVCDNPGSVGESVVILEDGVRAQIVEIWDGHWLQNLIPDISLH